MLPLAPRLKALKPSSSEVGDDGEEVPAAQADVGIQGSAEAVSPEEEAPPAAETPPEAETPREAETPSGDDDGHWAAAGRTQFAVQANGNCIATRLALELGCE